MAMHYSLSNTYRVYALITETLLLTASVIFLATTFANNELYTTLNFDPSSSRVYLGIASTLAFLCSLILLLLNWPGKASRHKDSADRFFVALSKYRDLRNEDGSWPNDKLETLYNTYLYLSKNTVDIPDKKFNKLKSQYLTKVEVSKLISKHPGLPSIVAYIYVRLAAIISLLRSISV